MDLGGDSPAAGPGLIIEAADFDPAPELVHALGPVGLFPRLSQAVGA
jgi:hypothetical protein